MKTIELKTFPGPEGAAGAPYQQAMVQILGGAPARGLSTDELMKRVRVLEAIDALADGATELELEDADAATLLQAVNDHAWPAVIPGSGDFVKHIRKACA